jgi:Arc/MetJ-type ribon-helix-helix transcriptional regulator
MPVQVAIRLPDDLVAEVDRLVHDGTFESRSQAIRSGLEAIVAGRRRQELERRYAEAPPETDQELAEATRLAVESIHDEPWERWW